MYISVSRHPDMAVTHVGLRLLEIAACDRVHQTTRRMPQHVIAESTFHVALDAGGVHGCMQCRAAVIRIKWCAACVCEHKIFGRSNVLAAAAGWLDQQAPPAVRSRGEAGEEKKAGTRKTWPEAASFPGLQARKIVFNLIISWLGHFW